MLYICKLTHPITGISNYHFDTRENCDTYARLNNDDFVSEVRPARTDEIKKQLSDLRKRRKSIQFNYEYSPWSMGPGYRASLARLDSQLLRLTAALDDLHIRSEQSPSADSDSDSSPQQSTDESAEQAVGSFEPDDPANDDDPSPDPSIDKSAA